MTPVSVRGLALAFGHVISNNINAKFQPHWSRGLQIGVNKSMEINQVTVHIYIATGTFWPVS